MSLAVLFELGILDSIVSIALAHCKDDLFFIPAILKILEYLSQNIKKYLCLVSVYSPTGSGLGTVSTCISSRKEFGVDYLVLVLAACLIVASLHDVQKLSGVLRISTSSHRFSELIVENTPSDLWNLECSTSEEIRALRE